MVALAGVQLDRVQVQLNGAPNSTMLQSEGVEKVQRRAHHADSPRGQNLEQHQVVVGVVRRFLGTKSLSLPSGQKHANSTFFLFFVLHILCLVQSFARAHAHTPFVTRSTRRFSHLAFATLSEKI